MTDPDRRVSSGRDFEAIVFPKRAQERALKIRREAEIRARALGESLAHEHLQHITGESPRRRGLTESAE